MHITWVGWDSTDQPYLDTVLHSCLIPLDWIVERLGGLKIICEPYTGVNTTNTGTAVKGQFSIVKGGHTLAGYLPELVLHEFLHQIWFLMDDSYRSEWVEMCWEGRERVAVMPWNARPAEVFAECGRLAIFAPKYSYRKEPFVATDIVNAPTEDATRNFIECWFWDVQCVHLDLATSDHELRAATAYLAARGVMQGYTDGRFGPYDPLLCRHVALVCQRMGLTVPPWMDDYTPATRAMVRDNISGLKWDSERWDEPITRSQLARLMWRAR